MIRCQFIKIISIMKKKLFLAFFIGFGLVSLYAQDNPQVNNSQGNVPVMQVEPSLISDTQVLFDANGGTDSHIQVTCKDGWFSTNNDDWLEVSEDGDHLVVNCRPNPNPMARTASVTIVGMKGTRTGFVTVRQEAAGRKIAKSAAQTNPVPTVENQSISLKISFEAGKDTPSFENVWKILRLLEENKNLGLQIETHWCKNNYSIDLIEKRSQAVTDFFIASGVGKERISQHIIIDAEENNPECDRACLKITK